MIIRRQTDIKDDVTASAAANLTLDQLLLNQVRKGAHRPFICDPPDKTELTGAVAHQYTYREADMRVAAMAAVLRNIGLRQDDIVAVRLPNTTEAVIALLAIWRAGLVACLVPLSWRRREWSMALEAVSPKALITATRIGEEDAALTACLMAENQFSIRFVAAFGPDEHDGVIALDPLISAAMTNEPEQSRPAARKRAGDHVATITFMETPDGLIPVPRCHASWIATAMRPAADLGLGPGARLLSPFMMSHLTGLAGAALPVLLTGAMLILHQPFDLFALEAQFETHRPTHILIPASLASSLAEIENAQALRTVVRVTPFGIGVPPRTGFEDQTVLDYASFSEHGLLPLAKGADGAFGLRAGYYHVRDTGDGSPVIARLRENDTPSASGGRLAHQMIRMAGGAKPGRERHYLEIGGAMAPDGEWVETVRPSKSRRKRTKSLGFNTLPVVFAKASGGLFRATGFVAGMGAVGGLPISLDALDKAYGRIEGAEAAAVAHADDELAVGIVPKGTMPLDPGEIRDAMASLAIAEHKIAANVTTLSTIPRRGDGDIDRDQITIKATRKT